MFCSLHTMAPQRRGLQRPHSRSLSQFFHNSLSSVLSSPLEIEHFLKALMMIRGSNSSHASLTQEHTSSRVGFLMFPDGVKVWSSEEYQSFQHCCNITFMGLLILMSSGCNTLVMQPGMMAYVVLRSFSASL